ncbi:MAG: LacI family DNA-binding transcriptional regulator [Clostridia bacterium]
MITIKDIATAANVATSTVSYALNNDPRIPEETKHKIMKIAKDLGYQGKSGKKIGQGYSRQVVLCLNSINGAIYSEIVMSMKKVLNVNNCDLLIYIGKEVNRLKWLDGLFVLNSQVPTDAIQEVIERKIPVVIMDRKLDIDGATSVSLANFDGGYETTSAIIKKGAKTFAFVGGPESSYESKERYNGFNKALTDNYLQRKDTPVLQSDFTYNGGVNVSHFLLGLPTLPSAIICANDEMAMGIMDGIAAKKPEALNKILFAGFDGSAPKRNIPYITARAERNHWGSLAAYTLLQNFDRSKSDKNITIPVELVEFF